MPSSLWEQCLSRLECELSAQQINTWLRPLQAEEKQNNLRLLAPNAYTRDWVKAQLEVKITQLVKTLSHGVIHKVIINVGGGDAPNLTIANSSTARPAEGLLIDPKFTFESFVEGKSNQIARAASLHVADYPGDGDYNPLFLYGDTGLGKTHLMGAIGNKIRQDNANAKVIYVSSQRFVQDMVTALRNKSIDKFKSHYWGADILLVDDIQFFATKKGSQEELFYAFNALMDKQKQIVLTCDTLPRAVQSLDGRLKSRFGWGLSVALEPPELEMRVAILLNKAQQKSAKLPQDVAFFVAERICSNVRELEGALQKMLAYARFTNHPLSVDLAKDALKDLLVLHQRLITLDSIQKTTAEYFKIRVSDLLSKRRNRSITRPRQIAMALSRELTNHSLPEIGEAFGGRDHTTVLHACERIAILKEENNDIAEDYRNLFRILSV